MDFDFTLETISPTSSTILSIGGVGALQLPSGTTGNEPAGAVAGALRWNTSTPGMEYYNGTSWVSFGAVGVSSITGTTNQITASASTGAITLSTPTTFTAPGYIRETSGLYNSTTIGIIATGSTQATATSLTTTYNVISTAPVGSGVILPTPLNAGWAITVFNRAANSVIVYPNSGAAIDSASTNAGIYIPPNQFIIVQNASATQWYTVDPIYSASTGISLSITAGNIGIANTGVISIGGTAGNITTSGSTGSVTVNLATAGTAGTYGQVTTDSFGRVVAGGVNSLANGGTNANLTAVNGAVVYSSATALALTAAGTTGQVLTSNGAAAPTWATVGSASYSVNVGPAGTIAWTLASGTTYTATITHNLGTQNVVVQTTDISNNQITYADVITITSATQIIIQVSGTGSNLKTLRTVIIANGASIAAGASTPSSVIVQNNGVALSGTYTTLNLIGVLNATNAGAGIATIVNTAASIIRTLSYFATSLDSPNNADWVINALAPTTVDPSYAAIDVRQYSNTTEQGVGLFVPIPSNATNITFTYKGRSASATAGTLQMRFYSRSIASTIPAAVPSWSAANNLTSVSSPANTFYQTYTYTATLASLSLTAGNMYQFEFTRNVSVAGNLAFNWLMVELDIAFT